MITSWDQLPLVMGPQHVAALLDVRVSTVWRRCRQRTMRPRPRSWDRPYQWSRDAARHQMESGGPFPTGRPGRRRGAAVQAEADRLLAATKAQTAADV